MVRMRRWTLAAGTAALMTWIAAGSVLAADSPVASSGSRSIQQRSRSRSGTA